MKKIDTSKKDDIYLKKFKKFLSDNNLFDVTTVNYFLKKAIFSDVEDFDLTNATNSFTYIYNRDNEVVEIIPYIPAFNSDRAVLFNIIAYIRLLNSLIDGFQFASMSNSKQNYKSMMNKLQGPDKVIIDYNETLMLCYYSMLYLKKNPDLKLTKKEKGAKRRILKYSMPHIQAAFNFCEYLINDGDTGQIKQITNKVKRKLIFNRQERR